MEAVTFLTEEQVQEPSRDVAAAEPSPWEGSAVGKQLPQSKSFVAARPDGSTRFILSQKGKYRSSLLLPVNPAGPCPGAGVMLPVLTMGQFRE